MKSLAPPHYTSVFLKNRKQKLEVIETPQTFLPENNKPKNQALVYYPRRLHHVAETESSVKMKSLDFLFAK
jgi:hypothetical protein